MGDLGFLDNDDVNGGDPHAEAAMRHAATRRKEAKEEEADREAALEPPTEPRAPPPRLRGQQPQQPPRAPRPRAPLNLDDVRVRRSRAHVTVEVIFWEALLMFSSRGLRRTLNLTHENAPFRATVHLGDGGGPQRANQLACLAHHRQRGRHRPLPREYGPSHRRAQQISCREFAHVL